jgi:polysaccharide biosynthesis/export protein
MFNSLMNCTKSAPHRACSKKNGASVSCLVRGILVFACGVSLINLAHAEDPNQVITSDSALDYVLGPGDQIVIRALDVDEIDGKTAGVDFGGYVDIPLLGKFKAAGLTVANLEADLAKQFSKFVRDPHISVIVSEYRSQPVSVLGAVNTPGVINLAGPSTLMQVLSRAGGLRADAGNTIRITRRGRGTIPLSSSSTDPSGNFTTAEIGVRDLLEAKNPEDNILIKPQDSISVPRGDLVYVVGGVNKAGGFVLNERESMSVLQAVSMAEGLDKTSAPKSAKIIRGETSTSAKAEIPVDLSKILSGQAPDIPLRANDILFVPNSRAKSAAFRGLEAAIQLGTGVVVYRR